MGGGGGGGITGSTGASVLGGLNSSTLRSIQSFLASPSGYRGHPLIDHEGLTCILAVIVACSSNRNLQKNTVPVLQRVGVIPNVIQLNESLPCPFLIPPTPQPAPHFLFFLFNGRISGLLEPIIFSRVTTEMVNVHQNIRLG